MTVTSSSSSSSPSSSSSSSSSSSNNNNKKKTLFETIFKSKEFMLDVYIRFDCLLYFILSILGIYSPYGFKSVINYLEFFKNPNFTAIDHTLDQSEDIEGASDQLLQQNQQHQQYDFNAISKFYENQIFTNLVSMYSVLLAVVTFIQSIIALKILLAKDKSVKVSNINLLLMVDLVIVCFNIWVVVCKASLFISMGYIATLITLLISIGDFLVLFYLSSSNKSLLSLIKSTINSIISFTKSAKKVYKEELKKKQQQQQQQKKNK